MLFCGKVQPNGLLFFAVRIGCIVGSRKEALLGGKLLQSLGLVLDVLEKCSRSF